MALLALLDVRHAAAGSWRASLLVVGLVGAALLYGDGVITPAISVLSAVEGLKLDAPAAHARRGSDQPRDPGRPVPGPAQGNRVHRQDLRAGDADLVRSRIALLGLAASPRAPGILAALNPLHAVAYLVHAGPGVGFAVLGAAFLAVTGGEAMYADMGHFGRLPIRLGWFAVVLPGARRSTTSARARCCSPTRTRSRTRSTCWRRNGPITRWCCSRPLATIIASQAIISGAFSLTQQAIQLGFLPRMRVLHTASHERGQIYIPLVNWLLAAGTLGAVITFGSSDALGGAYGIAVSMLMAITTVLAALVALQWGYNPLAIMAVNGLFLVIDLIFVAANATKLLEGGWFPLLLAAFVAFLMLTWRTGWRLLEQQRSPTAAARGRVRRVGPPQPAAAPARRGSDLHRRDGPAFRSG